MKSHGELRDLAKALHVLRTGSSGRAALVTILRTSGSTFRRVGAAMLVRHDGSIVNALAGGCPQRDLVERAQQAMVSGQLAYVSYNAENGFDLMVETGCGGELDVVVEPVTSLSLGFLGALDDALASQRSFRVVTDFPAAGDASSTVRRIEMLEANEGSCAGDAASSEFRSDGTAVLTEQFDAPVSLVIAGAGTQSADLAIIASQLGWRGVIVDPSVERIAAMALAVPGWSAAPVRPEALMDALRVSEATALVAMTHHLDVDVAYLRAGEAYGAFYLGALGSRERARTIMSMVQSPVLHVPAGLDIGSNATTEISVSIVAEIMAVRSARDGTALSRRRGPIHGKKPAPLSLTA